MTGWVVYRCANPRCGLRFPAEEGVGRCPRCAGPVTRGARWAAPPPEPPGPGPRPALPRRAVVLENLRSAWNVGALLRVADAAGFHHAFLVGITPTPAHPQVAKTALGAQHSVGWSWHPNGVALLRTLRALGWTLWALETAAEAQALPPSQKPPDTPWAWVVGNEVTGLDPQVLALCQRVWRLPMRGRKRSLNVATAFAAAAYRLADRALASGEGANAPAAARA